MSIGSISIGKQKCLTIGGYKCGRVRVELKFRVDRQYRLRLLVDGKPFGGYQWTSNKRFKYHKSTHSKEEIDTVVYVDLPSDAQNHNLALEDTQTADQSGETTFFSNGCRGGVIPTVESLVEDPATGEKKYTVSLFHNGAIKTNLTGYVYLNGNRVGSSVPLKPRQKAIREVIVPATGDDYVISAGFTSGRNKIDRTLWLVVESNEPPVADPGTWNSATSFDIGETVVISSAVGEVPLETDGSEWVLLEYSPAEAGTWNPLAPDGLVEPGDGGVWSYQLLTGASPFVGSTSWDIRARRYKDYRESSSVIHSFAITGTTYVPESVPIPVPKLLAPVNKTAKSGTRVYLSGTGPAGARLHFQRRRVSGSGTVGSVPATCTVGKDGKWKTSVSTTSSSTKTIAYSARAHLNGRISDLSNEQRIRWVRRR